jgi:hypothetical protein
MTVITRLNTDRPDSPHSKQTLHLGFFKGGVGLQTAENKIIEINEN